MTDFQIFEDKYQVPLSLIILKMEKIEQNEKLRDWYMSVLDEAARIEP